MAQYERSNFFAVKPINVTWDVVSEAAYQALGHPDFPEQTLFLSLFHPRWHNNLEFNPFRPTFITYHVPEDWAKYDCSRQILSGLSIIRNLNVMAFGKQLRGSLQNADVLAFKATLGDWANLILKAKNMYWSDFDVLLTDGDKPVFQCERFGPLALRFQSSSISHLESCAVFPNLVALSLRWFNCRNGIITHRLLPLKLLRRLEYFTLTNVRVIADKNDLPSKSKSGQIVSDTGANAWKVVTTRLFQYLFDMPQMQWLALQLCHSPKLVKLELHVIVNTYSSTGGALTRSGQYFGGINQFYNSKKFQFSVEKFNPFQIPKPGSRRDIQSVAIFAHSRWAVQDVVSEESFLAEWANLFKNLGYTVHDLSVTFVAGDRVPTPRPEMMENLHGTYYRHNPAIFSEAF